MDSTVPIYLDYNATAPMSAASAEALIRAARGDAGNPSSLHRYGQAAKAALDEARDRVAALVGGEASEIVFTSGGTEADNLAIRGGAQARSSAGRRHLVVAGIEHEAVLHTAQALASEGWTVAVVPADASGRVDPGRVRETITAGTAVVAVMLANNETGVIQSVAECAQLARAQGALCHTDAVQAAGRIPVDVRALGVDTLALSAHKFGGPPGAGALWVRKGLALRPQVTGGRQERNRRAGTENVPAIAAMGTAAAEAAALARDGGSQVGALRDRLETGLLATIDGCAVNGAADGRIPNTSSISFDRVEGESLVIALDLEGIAVSTGSACSSGTLEPSHVLRAMGLPPSRVQSAVRFSLGPGTTPDEIDRVLDVVPRLVARLRRLAPRGA